MKVIDIVKPEPKNELERYRRQKNWWASDLAQLNRYRRVIKIK